MGSPALWEHHRRNYNTDHDKPAELIPLKKKSNVPAVNVVKTDTTGKKKKKKT
jgi:hypothetical protein